MKSIKYILTSSLLTVIGHINIFGCGPLMPEDPRHLHIFRICSPVLESQWQEGCRFQEYEKYENALLWQKITSQTIPLNDIKTVIYETSLRNFKKDLNNTLTGNKFMQWLQCHENIEDRDYVLIAKEIEEIRDHMNDCWYYPYEGDEEHERLEQLLEKCKAYSGSRHKDRYGLQILRLYFAKKDFQSCIDLWNRSLCYISKNIVTDMATSYVGGAYYRMGNKEKAIELYEQSQDIGSLINIKAWDYVEAKSQYKDFRVRELEYIFNRFPNSPLLSVKLQEHIRERESFIYNYEEWSARGFHDPVGVPTEWAGDSLVTIEDKPFYDELKKFAVQVIGKKKCSQKGMWNYTLAYLAYLEGDETKARYHLKKSCQYKNTPLIQSSINSLNILLDATNMGNTSHYLSRLQKDLKWIDEQMVAEHKLVHENDWQYKNKLNLSVDYWQDVIRKILLGEIIPRLINSGNTVLALQLSNYTSNRIHQLYNLYESYYDNMVITFDEYRNSWSHRNNFDYSNQFFELINSVSAIDAEKYAERIVSPKNELDKFLNERGYTDNDYIFEIVGTLYLREMNYAKAVEWLSKVSSDYQHRTNLAKEGYFELDPFSFQDGKKDIIIDSEDYKLRFAQEMFNLENIIKSDAEQNRKANAKIRFATGLRNSFGRCWYLTQYGYDMDYYEGEGQEAIWVRSNERSGFKNNRFAEMAYYKVDLLMEEALNEFTNAEQAALAYLKMKNFRTLMKKFPDSKAATSIRGRCDNYYDYALQKL